MTFEEYLTKRRVNVAAFAAGEPARFAEWQAWYGQMHPESFYMLVKMVLNDVRRNFWLAEIPKPIVTAETTTTPNGARPSGRRAAISKPAETPGPETIAAKPITPAPEILEIKPAETEEVIPKPRPVFKPRGVIKKSTDQVVTKPATETPEIEKPANISAEIKSSSEVNPEAEKPTTETSEATSAKPARPRAVIKRPAALNKAEPKPEETAEKTVADSTEKAGEKNSGTSEIGANLIEQTNAEKPAETPKPSRPRPVFKRPSATASSSEIGVTETEKTVAETPQKPAVNETKTENPVAIPGQEGASQVKAISEEIQQSPEAAKAAEEVAAEAGHVPKPARPRPVFKRPTPAKISENSPENAEKAVPEIQQNSGAEAGELPPENQAQNTTGALENSAEKAGEPAPKPPRPRPVFKRPTKPEEGSE